MLLPAEEANPVLHIEELARFPWRRTRPVPGAVHVYLSRHDHLYAPEGGFTIGELWMLAPRRLYVIDVAPHHYVRHLDVTSRSSGVTAGITLSCQWRVHDARLVVASSLVDVMTVVPGLVRDAVTTALAGTWWDDSRHLEERLREGVLPERVRADAIELYAFDAEVVALADVPPAQQDDDD
ncbi:hypothetical protein V6W11_27800 [Micromonospora profundi]|uniref:hypothetical protein n=1 Tax=Micromonospora TaxID=1873 RepID=UPI0006AE7C9F|nr:hypothetical protein [Micromonospora sp. NRRL B-16802]KOX07675.1 hypothetical protein ADK66_19000 [Micromonospora sp. NRRL B-16802]